MIIAGLALVVLSLLYRHLPEFLAVFASRDSILRERALFELKHRPVVSFAWLGDAFIGMIIMLMTLVLIAGATK